MCATHADLEAAVAEKRFRADLFSRIRGYVVRLPPLRERKQDVMVLVHSLLARLERPHAKMTVSFVVALVRYDWPFNVRELFATLRRAVALCPEAETLDVHHLPDELLRTPSPSKQEAAADRPDIPTPEELKEALRTNDGNVAAVARLFKRDRSLIHRWLKEHGLDPAAYRR